MISVEEENLIQYWGMKSALVTAEQDKTIEIAKNLIKLGLNNEMIVKATGLAIKEVEKLRAALKK